MTVARLPFAAGLVAFAVPVASLLGGCSGEIECKTEVTTGSASFHGAAVGKAENEALKRESVRDACRQKCANEQAALIDPCSAACVIDVGAKKLGAKTTCGRK